jgi:tRNA/rRNA methyltransferase
VIVLVEPQMAENIGAVARAMANFGLDRLRLVAPRDGWPNPRAVPSASGAGYILEAAAIYPTLAAAIGDLTRVYATTARAHAQAKPVVDAEAAAREVLAHHGGGGSVGLVFGRERNGLENDEVALADAILTLPVNPDFSSLNLAQAVIITAYEWWKRATAGALPFETFARSEPAPREQLIACFEALEQALDEVAFFRPPDKREVMTINLRNIILRMQPTRQDIQTLHGALSALVGGRKGPAESGTLDAAGAETLRRIVVEAQQGAGVEGRSPVRGLARLMRRNPTEAEKRLWPLLTRDRRTAPLRFKRQEPIGPHVGDFVSFDLRLVVDLVPDPDPDPDKRAKRRDWLEARGYHVLELDAQAVAANPEPALAAIDAVRLSRP